MDRYWHHVCHHLCCYGPLLTRCQSSLLLLWAITDTMPVITAVAIGHYWHHVRFDSACPSLGCVTDRRTVTTAKTRSCVQRKFSETTSVLTPRPSCSSPGKGTSLFSHLTIRSCRPSFLRCAHRLIFNAQVSQSCCVVLVCCWLFFPVYISCYFIVLLRLHFSVRCTIFL